MKNDSIDKEYPVIKKMYQLTLDYTNRVKISKTEAKAED